MKTSKQCNFKQFSNFEKSQDLAVHVVHSSLSKLLVVGKLENITISHFDRRSRHKYSEINGR